MNARTTVAALLLLLVPGLALAQPSPDADGLRRQLDEFLAGASRDDAAVHERFWADDLIYTGSSGRRVGKADILRDVRASAPPRPGEAATVYGAEDVRIQQYGDTAIVAFRLVGTTVAGGRTSVSRYLNSGTFLKRGGAWQAVSWQATRLPRPEEEARKEAAAALEALHQALLAADVKALQPLLAEGFVWTQRAGDRRTRAQLLDSLASGALRYSKLEARDASISVHGDTAVARGATERQRSACPGCPPTGDAAPFTAFYTLTFVNEGNAWKAVALHTSRTP
jgi:hypothetical protein